MKNELSKVLLRLRASEIKKDDMKLLVEAGCSFYAIAKLYSVPAWVISNKISEFGLHKNFYAKIQLEKRPIDFTKHQKIITDQFVRTVLDIGYSHTYPSQSDLARDLGVTYTNLVKRTIPLLHHFGFIEFVRENKRTKRVKLTEKGLVLFKKFVEIVELLNEQH